MADKKAFSLRDMPDDVWEFLIKEQTQAKLKKKISQFSIEQTIYKCLRDYKRCREENNFKE